MERATGRGGGARESAVNGPRRVDGSVDGAPSDNINIIVHNINVINIIVHNNSGGPRKL